MEIEDHREDPIEEPLTHFMCGDRDIFADDPVMDSQLECVVEASTQVGLAVPPRDLEIAKALEPTTIFSWVQNVLEESDPVESLDSRSGRRN